MMAFIHSMEDVFSRLIEQWDLQQESYHPFREERYDAMFDLLEITGRRNFRIVDIASGPGSLSLRFLKRFPGSETVMVDQDPVLLRMSREAFKKITESHSWLESDITDATWMTGLEKDSFDAVMSTTALHWLDSEGLKSVFRHSHNLLRPGGIFVNGDVIHGDSDTYEFEETEKKTRELNAGKHNEGDAIGWDAFWEMVRDVPELAAEMAVRDRIYEPGSSHGHRVTLKEQSELLTEAGFRVLGVVWSRFNDRVLVAVK